MPLMRLFRLLPALLALAAPSAAQDKEPAFLGVAAIPVDASLRANLKLPDEAGVLVVELVKKSAADRAGFRPGDVITSFAGKPLASFEQLQAAVAARNPGDKVAYAVRRGSGSIKGSLVLGARMQDYEVERLPRLRATGDPTPSPPPEKKQTKPRNLDERLDRAEEEVERLLKKAKARKKRNKARDGDASGNGLARWITRERRRLAAARKAGDEEKIAHHEARLGVLREMRSAGARVPSRRADRLEKKLDEILRLLRRRGARDRD